MGHIYKHPTVSTYLHRPLQNWHPLTDRQKIVTGDYVGDPLQLCQIWCTSVHGGLLGEWVKYN